MILFLSLFDLFNSTIRNQQTTLIEDLNNQIISEEKESLRNMHRATTLLPLAILQSSFTQADLSP
jgi:hypothetical protein